MRESIEDYVKDEVNQKKINVAFISVVLFLVTAQVLINAYHMLPGRPLFYMTSDAVEMWIACLIALVLYYRILPNDSLRFRFFCLLLSVIILVALALLKDYRRGQELESAFSEFASYLGIAFIFGWLFYFFDNLNLFINNSYVKTKRALREAENRLLRQRLNPHFLFNAFNSLYSLSLQKNPKTSDSILLLSGMMRYMTDEAQSSRVLLKQELKFIRGYIEVEKIRFGASSDITLEYDGNIAGQLIEPLLLITLVENAFKHGFYTNDPQAFIKVTANVEYNRLVFTVRNSVADKQHFQTQERTGKGLELLRKRLSLSYPDASYLKTGRQNAEYVATLKLTLT